MSDYLSKLVARVEPRLAALFEPVRPGAKPPGLETAVDQAATDEPQLILSSPDEPGSRAAGATSEPASRAPASGSTPFPPVPPSAQVSALVGGGSPGAEAQPPRPGMTASAEIRRRLLGSAAGRGGASGQDAGSPTARAAVTRRADVSDRTLAVSRVRGNEAGPLLPPDPAAAGGDSTPVPPRGRRPAEGAVSPGGPSPQTVPSPEQRPAGSAAAVTPPAAPPPTAAGQAIGPAFRPVVRRALVGQALAPEEREPGSTVPGAGPGAISPSALPRRMVMGLRGVGSPQATTAPQPTVQVTIGRIEVRAVTPPSPPAPRAAAARPGPQLSLDDYLKQRSSEER